MRLFNHEIEFPIQRLRHLLARITYDDAFGDRRTCMLKFDKSIKFLRVGGTASSSIDVKPGLVLDVDLDQEHLLVLGDDGQHYTCVRSPFEQFIPNQEVLIAQHMDHRFGNFLSFNHLATSRPADFRLHSIRVIGFDVHHQETTVVYIDPFTQQINYNVDTARIER